MKNQKNSKLGYILVLQKHSKNKNRKLNYIKNRRGVG